MSDNVKMNYSFPTYHVLSSRNGAKISKPFRLSSVDIIVNAAITCKVENLALVHIHQSKWTPDLYNPKVQQESHTQPLDGG